MSVVTAVVISHLDVGNLPFSFNKVLNLIFEISDLVGCVSVPTMIVPSHKTTIHTHTFALTTGNFFDKFSKKVVVRLVKSTNL